MNEKLMEVRTRMSTLENERTGIIYQGEELNFKCKNI